jgi:hypothetical protein
MEQNYITPRFAYINHGVALMGHVRSVMDYPSSSDIQSDLLMQESELMEDEEECMFDIVTSH